VTRTATAAQTCSSDVLRKKIEEIASTIDGPVGAAALLIESGEFVEVNGNRHFPMQSVYKLPIGMALVNRIDSGSLRFDDKILVKQTDFVSAKQHSPLRDAHPGGVEMPINGLLNFMVSESDGTACDVLLDILGGPEKVTAYLRELGINDILVATSEKAMGRDEKVQYQNWATPSAMIQLLRLLHEGHGVSATSRDILISLIIISQTGPQRIKGMLPPGTKVAHKTGSSGTIDGLTRATNDVGLVTLPGDRHLAIAVFVSDTTADEKARDGVIAKITRAVWDCWAPQSTGR
jgi:beta-lactamase class A